MGDEPSTGHRGASRRWDMIGQSAGPEAEKATAPAASRSHSCARICPRIRLISRTGRSETTHEF